ncbi:class C beta-lactamase [Trinickia dabaoshanensis]|uniref:Beta-lactamase n=2 Tax=Trinickia dabaoshanensis TaxID=564714 RepID=A0A2N7VDN3_9BURK|nr:class C beta-lactamase [Trinickia dabaoshanensis]PMS15270.1 class C beta-lactamase [Trinickia dabaoshanensis]
MKTRLRSVVVTIAVMAGALTAISHAAEAPKALVRKSVDAVIEPLMRQNGIHGMAVGVIADGKPYVFNYGLASTETGQPVTDATLFELGSISKTLTATLVSYADTNGDLSLTDPVSKYLPGLAGKAFGKVELVNLGTHTPGGVPLQVPDSIKSNEDLLAYLKAWQPAYAPGTYRTYSNLGIGLLGEIAAKSMDGMNGMNGAFTSTMQRHLFPALGMTSTFIDVPKARVPDYAQGYTKQGGPVRMSPGVLSAPAYGVKSTATDMLRFLDANMRLSKIDEKWQRAVTQTHTGYFQAGAMTQDLIWEQYPYPVKLDALLQGNSAAVILNATPVARIDPPEAPNQSTWINKTGSTNGFGAYIAFVPQERLGIVLLANKNFPIEARVRAAYRILSTFSSAHR